MKHFKTFLLLTVLSCLVLAVVLNPNLIKVFGSLVIGGVITSGILGGFSGKVGNVVGGKWKQTDYMRVRVIPKNPQSVDQTHQRNRMKMVVLFARQIKSTIIDAFWNPFYSSMSGFNAFTKFNASYKTYNSEFLLPDNVMSKGTLQGILDFAVTYTVGTGALSVTFTDNTGIGNALATDTLALICADKNGTLYGVEPDGNPRGDESASLTVASGLEPSDLVVYGFFYRGTGSALIVSDSSGIIPIEA